MLHILLFLLFCYVLIGGIVGFTNRTKIDAQTRMFLFRSNGGYQVPESIVTNYKRVMLLCMLYCWPKYLYNRPRNPLFD